MRSTRALQEIFSLDPERDHQRIMYLAATYEFTLDLPRSLEFALFRTFAVPSVSYILAATGEFTHHPQRRYDDTGLLISTIYEEGYDSEPGRATIRRMNQIHCRFYISNDDYLYVLSTPFVFEPIRWIRRFGYRPMTRQEELAAFYFWQAIGRPINIRDIPAFFSDLECYNVDYERAHFRYSDTNRRIDLATRDLFLGWVLPCALVGLESPVVYALMVLDAFGFPIQSPGLRRAVERALRLRSRTAALLPERRRPHLRTRLRRSTYPQGYSLRILGPADSTRPPQDETTL